MYFKATFRYNPRIGKSDWYYRLVESYRNVLDQVRQRTVLSVGFMDGFTQDQIDQVQVGINERVVGQPSLFADRKVSEFVEYLYQRMIREKKIDIAKGDKEVETVDLKTLKNKDIREAGAEWLALQALRQLGLESCLSSRNWIDQDISLALSHIVSRAVYPASELKTLRYMQENSSVCEFTGFEAKSLTKDRLYCISKKLYEEKAELEQYLSRKTNQLFDIQDNIILYDLTNSYFEGEKRHSNLARYGRSKEKRSDCPLVVLALVVNVEGFIKYTSVYQGNISDSKTLCDIIDHLRISTSQSDKRAIVVIDAGIATEDNLALIQEKGYDYVCVSRSTKAEIRRSATGNPVEVLDKQEREITLEPVLTGDDSTYYLKVKSPGKTLKEKAMKTLFEERFEAGLECIAQSLAKKSGIKTSEKVIERIGRLKQKYASAHSRYVIEVEKQMVKKGKTGNTTHEICTAVHWRKNEKRDIQKLQECGEYFLRTSIKENNETLIWTVYNCIRNIESSFRALKTDLDLRAVFHHSDIATHAHLHLALLAYWVVNTVRYQLKQHGINPRWREIVRIMNTQKCVTTTVQNVKEEWISIRQCSLPETKAKQIYDARNYNYAPYLRKKSVVPKPPPQKTKVLITTLLWTVSCKMG